MGGRTAYTYAATHPSRVRRLVIVDRGPDTMAIGKARAYAPPARVDFTDPEDAVDNAAAENPRAELTALRDWVLPNLIQRPDKRWTWRYDPALNVRTQQDPGAEWALLPKITCPTLSSAGRRAMCSHAKLPTGWPAACRTVGLWRLRGPATAFPKTAPKNSPLRPPPFSTADARPRLTLGVSRDSS